jgi:hypothetical protein
VLEHATAAAPPMALAAHPAFAAHAGAAPLFRAHVPAVTAPTMTMAEAHSVGAVMAAPEAVTLIFDPLGSSHIVLVFHLDISN